MILKATKIIGVGKCLPENIDIGLGISLAQGEYSSFNALLDKIKDQIAEISAEKVVEKIQKADAIMTEELEATNKKPVTVPAKCLAVRLPWWCSG